MIDLISRKALCEYALNQKNKSVTPNDIMRFPSEQPSNSERCVYQAGYAVGYRKGYMDAQQKHTKENRA